MTKRLITFLALIIFSISLIAQEIDSNPSVVVITKDGTELKGLLTLDTDKSIILKTSYGEITVERENIKSLTYINKESIETTIKDDSYASTHHYLTQSGYALRKGQSYYENTYLFWNSYTHGFTDNFSLSLGGEAISLLVSEFPVLFVTPKLSFPFKGGGGAFSVSTTIFTAPYNDFTTFGFLQGALTFGSRKDNLTIGTGVGYGFSDGFTDGFVPVIISGMKQASKRISLVSENWFFSTNGDTFGVLSLGLRIHSLKNNNYLSIALLRTTEDQGSLLAIPFFSGVVAIN